MILNPQKTGMQLSKENQVNWRIWLNYTVFALVIIKILLMLFPSDAIDMAGYKAWSVHLVTKGLDDFYPTWHVVYAPGYMYLLWISGKLAALFNFDPKTHEILIKLWSVIADLGGAYLICLLGKKYAKERLGFWLGISYALNPAIFFNSSVWGQFESITATLLLLMVYCFINNLSLIAVATFALAVLFKPQSAILAPIAAVLFFKDFSWRKFCLAIVAGIGVYLLVVLPFSAGKPVYWIFEHFIKSGGDYPYATANAFNLWTILGGQTIPDNLPFLGFTYAGWGLLLMMAVVVFTVWLAWTRRNQPVVIFWASYLLCFGIFLLGSRMHERYLFPALIFLTAVLLWDPKLWFPLSILSLCHFGNTFYIYLRGWLDRPQVIPALAGVRSWMESWQKGHFSVWAPINDPVGLVIAWLTVAVFVYSIYYTFNLQKQKIFNK